MVKVLIPTAGEGKRLRPHYPKPLIPVTGKPILGHILDRVIKLNPKEIGIIINPDTPSIEEYIRENYPYNITLIEQPKPLGLGHAVFMARENYSHSPLLIVLGDTITDIGPEILKKENLLGVREVEDPRRFGVIEMKGEYIAGMVEKPEKPKSNLVIAGVYYFKDSKPLFEALSHIIERGMKTKGEYQITDALNLMIKRGEKFKPYLIEEWLDCGTPQALLSTNHYLVEKDPYWKERTGVLVISPVYIDDSTIIKDSIIGPYTSVSKGAEIRNSIIKDSIVMDGATIEGMILEGSLIGKKSRLKGEAKELNIGPGQKYEPQMNADRTVDKYR